MPRKATLIPEEIRDFVDYNPLTGDMWRTKIGNGRHPRLIGRPIRTVRTGGYYCFFFAGHPYAVARIAWFLMTGEQPDEVDHINGDRLDNRFCNLRNVSHLQNMRNRKRHREGLPLGICWAKDKNLWKVRLYRSDTGFDKDAFVGYRKTLEDAISLREEALRSFTKKAA